jgi:hypothetical protein
MERKRPDTDHKRKVVRITLSDEMHEAAAGEKPGNRGAELCGEKVKDIHP